MALELFAHPFSSYCQKVLIGLYENHTPFVYRDLEAPGQHEALAGLWPMKRFPVLLDGGRTVFEATTILEHLEAHHPGPVPLLPADPSAAVEVRMLDRFFDNYVMTPQGKFVADVLRPADRRDPHGVAEAGAMLDTAYTWLERWMAGRTWASGDTFGLADCAAAPSLFYADWTHAIPLRHGHVRAYRDRLLARPSFARAVDEARKFRHYFPLGAPARD